MGKSIFHTGPLGAGHAMKTINNYVAALNLISALQGLLVGKKYGLDPEQMVDIINASYGRNAATEFVLKQQITSGKFAANFKMWLAAKDARVMAETARHVGFSGVAAAGRRPRCSPTPKRRSAAMPISPTCTNISTRSGRTAKAAIASNPVAVHAFAGRAEDDAHVSHPLNTGLRRSRNAASPSCPSGPRVTSFC